MVTICIPVYNFNVSALINCLVSQATGLHVPCEIIAIDDCSASQYRESNAQALSSVRFVQLDQNIGRSKIRNLFLQYASFDNLLFLDCDSLIVSDHFLEKYVSEIPIDSEYVLCGGRMYDPTPPPRHKMLRWKYGMERESQPVEVRRLNANKSFMTNNFLIARTVLERIGFDERISTYGHEDTLFGYALKKRGIQITHIDNPVLNGDVEDNDVYLAKTAKGVENLVRITGYIGHNTDFIEDVSLLKLRQRLKRLGIKVIARIILSTINPLINKLLAAGHVHILLFDLYKLGLLLTYERKTI